MEWTIEEKIERAFPEDPVTAVAIAEAESSLNTEAENLNDSHNGCIGSFGLMQIACIHYDGDSEDLKDIDLNLKIARQIYDQHGWSKWGGLYRW